MTGGRSGTRRTPWQGETRPWRRQGGAWMEEAAALEEKEGKRQAGLGSRSLGEEDSLPRLIKSSNFCNYLFFNRLP